MTDKIIIQKGTIYEQGFGIISKKVMRDKNLDIEAKAIYSYFCSYAGNGFTAYPGEDLICFDLGISRNRYYKYLKQLKVQDYIRIHKHKNGEGKYENNIYELVLTPRTQIEDMEIEDIEIEYTNKNNSTKNNINKNNNLHHLNELNDEYVFSYLNIMKQYGYRHKRLTSKSMDYITYALREIKDYVDLDTWEEEVTEHFETLAEGRDGDILLFLKASRRHFDIQLEDL